MAHTTANRQVLSRLKPLGRCRRSSAQLAKKRAPNFDRYGFLKHRFLPFYACGGQLKSIEREFFNSLSQICQFYHLVLPDVKLLAYPQNVFQAWERVKEQIKTKDEKLDCVIMADSQHKATLATVRQMNTGTTLFYIPVRPLWNLIQVDRQQPLTDMLVAVFAYLHRVVEIPFYTEHDSYLFMQYETLDQWLQDGDYDEENEEEKEWQEMQMNEMYKCTNSGLHVYRRIIEPECLIDFKQKIRVYLEWPENNSDWATLAIDFLSLHTEYPTRSIFDNIRPDLFHPEAEERIGVEQYISFYWSGNDCLSDTLIDMVDTSFQEVAIMDEPLAVQIFDGVAPVTIETFDFEVRLFQLLNRLCSLLNPYDHEEREPTV